MRHVRSFDAILTALVLVIAGACTASAPRPPAVEPPQDEALRVTGQSVHRVQLEHPHAIQTPGVPASVASEAYVVQLEIAMPLARGPAVKLFVGDDRVAEYGGWAHGIYFKVYEAGQLERWNGKPLTYEFATDRRQSLGATLQVPALSSLQTEREADVVRRK